MGVAINCTRDGEPLSPKRIEIYVGPGFARQHPEQTPHDYIRGTLREVGIPSPILIEGHPDASAFHYALDGIDREYAPRIVERLNQEEGLAAKAKDFWP